MKPAGPSAHDHHLLARGDRRTPERDSDLVVAEFAPHIFGFATRAWILDASEPTVHAHSANAFLIAAQAQTCFVARPGAGLCREVGIGDLTAHNAHEIAVALGQGSLGLQRILEAPDTHHGQIYRFANGAGDEHRVAGRNVHARFDHEQACRSDTNGGVDVIDLTGCFDDLRDLHGFIDGGAAVDEFVAADAHAECEAITDDTTNGMHDVDQEARPVLQRAAIVVGALVGGGRQESTHDGRVAALQFDAVEAALGAMLGHQRIASNDLVDLSERHGLGNLAEQRIGHWRRGPHGKPAEHAAGLPTVVVDLSKDRRAVAMHGVGDRAVAGDDIAVETVDELLVRPVGGVGRVFLGDDQARSTCSARGVIRSMLLSGFAVERVVGEMRAEHNAVQCGHGSEL